MATRWWNKDTPFEVVTKLPKGGPRGPKIGGFTRAQIDTMQFWRDFASSRGFPPTFRDAATHFGGVSPNAIAERIDHCVAKGGLARAQRDRARGLQLTALGRSLTIDRENGADGRPLYIQTAHGFVGAVNQEKKCVCGQSHFTDNESCADCVRAFGGNSDKVVT